MVARDWRGTLVFPYSKRVNTNIPVQAEAEAVFWALHLAKKVDASHFVIEKVIPISDLLTRLAKLL